MKTEAERRAEREKNYKKWDPDPSSEFHWSKRGFSAWAMNNGDYMASFKVWKWLKLNQPKRTESKNDQEYKSFEKAHFAEDFSYETISRGKLADQDAYKMIKPKRVMVCLLLITGAKKSVDRLVT